MSNEKRKGHRVPKEAHEKWEEMAETKVKIKTPGKMGGTRSEAALRMPPGIDPDMFPDMNREQLLRRSETARPTIGNNGRIAWIDKGEPLYLGKDVSDVGEKGLSDAIEVKGIVREIEIDSKKGLLVARGVNSRTLTLRLAMAQIWAHHKKTKYTSRDKITPENVPLLKGVEVRKGLRAIAALRRKYGLNTKDTVSWSAFKKLVRALQKNMAHPSAKQIAARKAGTKRLAKLHGKGSKVWSEMAPEERAERMPGGEPNE
jgi:hypothetical protein